MIPVAHRLLSLLVAVTVGLGPGPATASPADPPVDKLSIPRLTGPVMDEARLLDQTWNRRLGSMSRAARALGDGKGPQLQYLIVETLHGEPIEEFSMRVAEAWKLGAKGRDDGLLITVALKESRVRIEVGRGLESIVTDVIAAKVIRETIVPKFRQGRYGEGLYEAGRRILSTLNSLPPELPQTR